MESLGTPTYGKGRRCKVCNLPLSIYNPGDACDPHTLPQAGRIHGGALPSKETRQRKARKAREAAA